MALTENELDDIIRRISSKDSESADLRSRMTRFLNELYRVMAPDNSCVHTVNTLLCYIDSPSLYDNYWRLRNQRSIYHLVCYANKAGIPLPPPRSVTALAVKRLRDLFVKQNEEAVDFVRRMELLCVKVNDYNLSPLKYLFEDSERSIDNAKAEEIAVFMYERLGIDSIPYIKEERVDGGVAASVLPNVLPEEKMRRPDSGAAPAGTGLYGALMTVFNENGNMPAAIGAVCKETGINGFAGRALAVLAANVPDGKQRISEGSIKVKNIEKSYLVQGLQELYEKGLAIRCDDGTVMIAPALAARLVSEMPKPKVAERLVCPRCGGTLLKRNGRHGPFYGCSNWPSCTYTENA